MSGDVAVVFKSRFAADFYCVVAGSVKIPDDLLSGAWRYWGVLRTSPDHVRRLTSVCDGSHIEEDRVVFFSARNPARFLSNGELRLSKRSAQPASLA